MSNADVYGSRKFGSLGLSPALLKFNVASRFRYVYFRRPVNVSNIVFLYSAKTLLACALS